MYGSEYYPKNPIIFFFKFNSFALNIMPDIYASAKVAF